MSQFCYQATGKKLLQNWTKPLRNNKSGCSEWNSAVLINTVLLFTWEFHLGCINRIISLQRVRQVSRTASVWCQHAAQEAVFRRREGGNYTFLAEYQSCCGCWTISWILSSLIRETHQALVGLDCWLAGMTFLLQADEMRTETDLRHIHVTFL